MNNELAEKNKPAKTPVPSMPPGGTPAEFPIVALGASAGGLEAFDIFFKAMPADGGIAFIIVSHLDPTHVSLLPELLQKRTTMPVHQIQDGMRVQRNHVYVIPPNQNLTILHGVLQLMDFSEPRGLNLPIDSFFRSLAMDQGANAACIIFSGTGTDGTLGLKAIKGEVGMVMVQDEASAKYDGMPRSAIATGLVDYILPPEEMPGQLIKYVRHASRKIAPDVSPLAEDTSNVLQKIFVILRSKTSHDFSLYKQNTILRRIERRMSLHQLDSMPEYLRYLGESDLEANALFRELLIGVTSFFRDAAAFDTLRDQVLPALFEGKPDDYTLRVWVPGCSTGEEAYSLAVVLHEVMEKMSRRFTVQIFGTDLDENAINQARSAVYPESIQADVSPDRLTRYFTRLEDGQYRIRTTIREMLVFAVQNVIKDPPFTKLDLVSCRNLLIYLGPEQQGKLQQVFHYALRQDGILFLGSSESLGKASSLFDVVYAKWRLFKRQASGKGTYTDLVFPNLSARTVQDDVVGSERIRQAEGLAALQLVESILQQSDTPPCAIIDAACNILYIHGRTGRFLEPAIGKMSNNLLDMARPGLKASLAEALHKAALHRQPVVRRGLRMGENGSRLLIDLSIKPLPGPLAARGLLMVVFEENPPASRSDAQDQAAPRKKRTVEELEEELERTEESLQTMIGELETTNEELMSANEELQSANEELQSTNEELETSKEELQSLNEESATVNAELQRRIEEITKINNDMKNLLDSTEIAALFLDLDQCIRGFTPRATDLIPLTARDEGRSIRHFSTRLIDTDLGDYATQVLNDLVVRTVERQTRKGEIYLMKVRPYRTLNNAIDGVVITFEQITARRLAEEQLRNREALQSAIKLTALDGYMVLDAKGRITDVNEVSLQMLGYSRAELLELTASDLFDPVEDETKEGLVQRLLEHEHDRFVSRHRRKDGQFITVEVSSAYAGEVDHGIVVFVRVIKYRPTPAEKEEEKDSR